MILDAEGAVIDYLTDRMINVVGNGNTEVEIHRYTFPDDAASTAIRVFCPQPGNDRDVPEIMPVGINITVRSPNPQTAFTLIQNVDLLLDKMVRVNLNDSIQLMLCSRNSGPNRHPGPNNDIWYQTALYDMILRKR